MSARHFELPADPSLEHFRKQAKQLHRAHADGDPDAIARASDVLGDRASERFVLTDAQFVLAQEHGFRSWAELRAQIETRVTGEDRPVSRIMGAYTHLYNPQVDILLDDLHGNEPSALRRLRAYVPRHADATDASTAERRDAELIIAREFGFPTWRELLAYTEKAERESAARQNELRQSKREAKALRDGDVRRLARLTGEQADGLLYLLALSEHMPGVRLDRELGVPREGVDVLIAKATDLDRPLAWAARFDRVEYIRLLLAAGARLDSRDMGSTPLEHAIYQDNTEVVDLLAEHEIVPAALWTYAACGRLDLVQACFDADGGGLRPETANPRPDLPQIPGIPPGPPPTDDAEEVIAEAFVHACQHGRIEVVRWFLDHGVDPNTICYYGQTGLHWAIPGMRAGVIRLLLERGTDPSIRDDRLDGDADRWLHISSLDRPHDPTTEQIHTLIESYSRKEV